MGQRGSPLVVSPMLRHECTPLPALTPSRLRSLTALRLAAAILLRDRAEEEEIKARATRKPQEPQGALMMRAVCTALQRCVAAFGARSKQDPNATDLKKLTAEELAEWEQRAREGSVLAVLASDLEQSQGARLSSFAKKQLLS